MDAKTKTVETVIENATPIVEKAAKLASAVAENVGDNVDVVVEIVEKASPLKRNMWIVGGAALLIAATAGTAYFVSKRKNTAELEKMAESAAEHVIENLNK
jgi:hypothetical protein